MAPFCRCGLVPYPPRALRTRHLPFLSVALFPLLVGCATAHIASASTDEHVAHDHVEGDLRVMTFNIQSARHGIDAVASVIRTAAPDIVALQEVDRGTTRAPGLDQAEALGERAGLAHRAYFRATSLLGGDYGVALLSRFPIVEAHHYRLPTPPGLEPRTVAHAILDVGDHQVSVYVTHLTNLPRRSAVRVIEARAISRLMSFDQRPKVVMGDFNDGPDSPAVLALTRQVRDVFDRAGVGPAETYPLPVLPDLRLDYVFASKDLEPRRAFVLRKLASDHYPLVADFRLPLPKVEFATSRSEPASR